MEDFIAGSILAERHNTGLSIFLLHSFATSETRVALKIGKSNPISAIVPNEKALDAFNHPCIYLDKTELELVGVK